MLLAQSILGQRDDPRYARRRLERLYVSSTAAAKRRFRARTDAGSDVAIDLPRGSYLAHGAVLFDDGVRIIVAEREPEDALVIRLSSTLSHEELLRQAALIGHAFGNQHVPIETANGEIHVPITTSREIAVATVERLALPGIELSFAHIEFARHHPLVAGHGHEAHVEPVDA